MDEYGFDLYIFYRKRNRFAMYEGEKCNFFAIEARNDTANVAVLLRFVL